MESGVVGEERSAVIGSIVDLMVERGNFSFGWVCKAIAIRAL
jgi:hypothetical protein